MSAVSSNNSGLYLGPGSTNTPGITNLYYAPQEFFQSFDAMAKADASSDMEGLVENGIRISTAPLSFFHSVASAAWYALSGGIFFHILKGSWDSVISPLSTFMAGTGLVICAVEAVLEGIGLSRTLQFNVKHAAPVEKNVYLSRLKQLQTDYFKISLKRLEKINQYIEKNLSSKSPEEQYAKRKELIDAALVKKKNDLTRRVHPWLAQEIGDSLPELIKDLEGYIPAKAKAAEKKAEEIFKNLQIQTQKKILIHSFGIAAVVLTMAGLILGLCAFPAMLPLLVMGVGSALAFARYFAYAGLMDSKGWEFKVSNCIPAPIKSIYGKIFAKKPPRIIKAKPWRFTIGPKAPEIPGPKLNYRIAVRV